MWYDIMSAISDLVMAAFAVIAGIYAKGQYDEAKQQRELALRQEQEARRQEAKQDELALRQQQEAQRQELKHERELLKANNRAVFRDRQREIAHVEAFAVKNGREYAVELSVPTEASIYEVRVWVQWPDEDFSYDNAVGNRDSGRSGNPHVAPGKKTSWRMLRPGNWRVGTTEKRFPWTQPERVNGDASAWKPVFADQRHEVVELEFTDCYGNKWRRRYGKNKDGQYVQSFVLIAAREPELADYVEV